MPFEVTTAVKKMLAMTARKKVVQGSTSSGKTYGIIPILIDKCLTKKIKATVVASRFQPLRTEPFRYSRTSCRTRVGG